MRKTALVLFDIDGTLLTGAGAGEASLRRGFEEAFGLNEDLHGIEIAGRTDSGIARALFAKHALPETPENFEKFFSGYLRNLRRELPARSGALLPGIVDLLQTLAALPHVALGLLTGNLERGAQIKLRHFQIDHFFPFGAFADDHHLRNALAQIAFERANRLHQTSFDLNRVFVLGDTPHDIACAKAIGAHSVAIATGIFPLESLRAHQPDTLFADLSHLPSVLSALGESIGESIGE